MSETDGLVAPLRRFLVRGLTALIFQLAPVEV